MTPSLVRTFAATLLVGCSSGVAASSGDGGTATGVGGGSDAATLPPVPRIVLEASIAVGTHRAVECPYPGTITIGSFGPPLRAVDDLTTDQGGKVSVSCSVKTSATGFDVLGQAQLMTANGGDISVSGTFTSSAEQSGIALGVSKAGAGFEAKDCVARIDASAGQGIAAGRLWVEIDCANAQNSGAQQTCATHVQLRLENCTQ